MYIASSDAGMLWVPDDVWYSFYNSPYVGHRNGTAVDVYYSHSMLFPCEEGRVREIRKVKTPMHIPFNEDYLIIVEMRNACLKILHVEPHVTVGEKLNRGDEVGILIPSGYFMPWSDKHAHIEFRRCEDARRARGGMPLRPIYNAKIPGTTDGEFVVVEKKEHYYWIKPLRAKFIGMSPVSNGKCSLEGGIPHYGMGAIIGGCTDFKFSGMRIEARNKNDSGVFLFNPNFTLYGNEKKIKGIGIFSNRNTIKMIGGDFEEGDTVLLKIKK